MKMTNLAPRLFLTAILCALLLGCSHPAPEPSGSIRYYAGADSLGYEARLGRVTFELICAVCHGKEGKGDGFNAYNLNPSPRDLTSSEFQKTIDDRHLADVIRYGGPFRGSSNLMPAWGGILSDNNIDNLINYIRFLGQTH